LYTAVFDRYVKIARNEPNCADEVRAYCPFHDDKEPSFSFNTKTGLWFCFSCLIGGTATDLITRIKGVSREEAELELKNITAPATKEDIDMWCSRLLESPSALGYLAGRCLLDKHVLSKYHIGYDGNRITIPVCDLDSNIINVRRLAITKQKRKVINTPGAEPYLWPVQNVVDSSGPIYICEGETDCLTALVQGLRAITGTGGAGTWRQEWSELFKGQDIIIAYDNDKAGRNGVSRILQSLKQHVASIAVLEVPENEDLNSLHQKGVKISDLSTRQPTEAETDEVEAIIEQIKNLPQEASTEEKLSLLQELAKRLAKKPTIQREYYLEVARKALGVTKEVLRKAVKSVAENAVSGTPTPLSEPRRTELCLPQYYHKGVFWYGIWLPTDSTGAGDFVFRHVTSERRLLEAPGDTIPPQDEITARWSVDSATPYNVFAWLRGETERIDPKQLFYDIRSVFQRFMWYPDDRIYSVSAFWVMMTYVFMVFDTTAYLTLTGTKRAGKSRTLELIEALAFNAVKAGTISASQIFRAVELNRHTLLFDESDALSASAAATQGGVDERLSIVLEGYKRAGKAGRIEGERLTPKWYHTYSPKAFASMNNLPDAVVDRSIAIKILRKASNKEIENLIFTEEAERFQILRNKLYCFGLENATRLAGMRKDVTKLLEEHGIRDRELEIWHSLVAIAILADADYEELIEYARASMEEKSANEQESSFTATVIQACYQLLEEGEPDDTDDGLWFLRSSIKDKVADIMDYDPDRITPQRIRNELVKTGIIEASSRFSRQLGRGSNRGKRVYRLDSNRVMDAVSRYGVAVGPGSELL